MINSGKKILEITTKGKLLFFGGVYSNLQALQALQQWCVENEYAAENIFCTGDILGYCAQPVECINLVNEWGIQSIAGNVEIQLRNNEDDCGCYFKDGGRCDIFSRTWYQYIRERTDAEDIDFLKTLPDHIFIDFNRHKIMLVHGSWFHTSEFIFSSTSSDVKRKNFDATGASIIVAGHSGLPFINSDDNLTWLNPGVIGMPANDGSTKVWFATMEMIDQKPQISFHQLAYNYRLAKKLMLENGLPASYAETLESGIWDNCEILPEAETKQQGRPITFNSSAEVL